MAGAGQVARGWDLDRIIKNYEQRINTLEKLARGAGTSAFLIDAPRWRSTLSANLTTTTATVHWLAFTVAGSAPEHDPAGNSNSFFVYSASTGQHRYTAQAAGLYWVQAAIQWNSNGTGTRKLHITKNNTGDAVPLHTNEVTPNAGAGSMHIIGGPVGLAAGDWIRIAAYQTSGGNLDIISNSTSTSSTGGRAPSNLTIIPIGAYDVA